MSNFLRLFQILFKISKLLCFVSFIKIILSSIKPLIIYIAITILIQRIEQTAPLIELLIIAVCSVTVHFLIILVLNIEDKVIDTNVVKVEEKFNQDINDIFFNISFSKLEDTEFLEYKDYLLSSIYGFEHSVVHSTTNNIIIVSSSLITLMITSYILLLINPLIIVLIAVTIAISFYIEHKIIKYEITSFERWIPLNRRYKITFDLLYNYRYAKDIRLYNAKTMFTNQVDEYTNDTIELLADEHSTITKYLFITNIVAVFQLLVTNMYIIYEISINTYNISVFPIYTGAIIALSDSLTNMIKAFVTLRKDSMYLSKFYEFLDLYVAKKGANKKLAIQSSNKIEFKNVYYQYPNTNYYALENINLTLDCSKIYSIVGANGSGKTTLIKLLQKLYQPTSGEILFNGININEFDDVEFSKIFGTVFQDYNIFSLSIKENIVGDDVDFDPHRFSYVCKETEVDQIIAMSKSGSDTRIFKLFDSSGIVPSGGQLQKISIARALYKKSQFLILDEPTSALDANYEVKLLNSLRTISDNKGAVFITHRLNSCAFADEVICLDNSKLCEQGSHQELIDRKSSYYNLYMKQASKFM